MKNLFALSLAVLMLLVSSCESNRYHKRYRSVSCPSWDKNTTAEGAFERYEGADGNTEEYSRIIENTFKDATQNPLSTFSIDVDNASYSNVRRFIENGQLPLSGAARSEELINYFNYAYEEPQGEHPFTVDAQIAECPWNTEHKLMKVGLKGKSLDYENLRPSNLVFLIDVSGSMSQQNKLPLLKKSFSIMIDNLPAKSTVAMVTYAGSSGLVLPPTPVDEKKQILKALNKLDAGGSTAGKAGIELAYEVALENLVEDGNNRVILATDGDFNVGVSSSSELVKLIEEKRKSDIYLTICGFGMGNYKDGRMEDISNAGNGNYFYIDKYAEAEKVFKRDLMANMFTIAKDVKIQVEFNPNTVSAYRLIGYENRLLQNEDFENDKIDAGELGAGHTVTALYEIVPASASADEVNKHGELNFQKTVVGDDNESLVMLKLRYKPIGSETSRLIETRVLDSSKSWEHMDSEFNLAASAAAWGMMLNDSKFKGDMSPELVISMAKKSLDRDEHGYRAEFVSLLHKTKDLMN